MSLAHQHQVDDLYEPQQFPAFDSAQQYFGASSLRATRNAEKVIIETGLDEAPRVEMTVTSRRKPAIMDPLQRAIDSLKSLRTFGEGWDSYKGKALEHGAIKPALELLLVAIHKCAEPAIRLNPAGGIDLAWEGEGRALELSVDGHGGFEGVLVVGDDEQDLEEADFGQARTLLETYCKL